MEINNSYSSATQFQKINASKIAKQNEISMTAELENNAPVDNFQKEYKGKTDKEKANIIYKSQTQAAGWSIFGSIFSCLYYALRSDDKIAKKYDLDKTNDKPLINEIRKKQTIATLPGVFELGVLGWIGFKVFAKPEK